MSRTTVLHDAQVGLGAKMIDFHGWLMPVQFAGLAAEHQAVRTRCGVFDLGHMGRLRVSGRGALAFLSTEVCRRLDDMKDGQVRYGLVLAANGTVEDDVLVSREGQDRYHVVVNASNLGKILTLWHASRPDAVTIEDLSDQQAMIAVQGPNAQATLQGLNLDGAGLGYYRFRDTAWRGCTVRLSRTGYTGEDGFECFLPADRAADLLAEVLAAGCTPCGLGARDTLRTEAGMPLYGNELDDKHSPVEAGLGFAINKAGGFRGAQVVLAQLKQGTARRLVGLRVQGKRVARHGYPVQHQGEAVGVVTSGTLSPTLGYPIAMAYVPSELSEPGSMLGIDIRGQTVEPAQVVGLPFYKRG